jgi:hypothetical protein
MNRKASPVGASQGAAGHVSINPVATHCWPL